MTRIGPFRREHWLRGIPEDDIGHVLGFFGIVPWLLYLLCGTAFTYLATVLGGPSGQSPLGIGALVLALLTIALIVTPSPTPLPVTRTVAVVIVVR